MRITRSTMAIALWLVASTAMAQQTPNTPVPETGQDTGLSTLGNVGQLDFGFRGTAFGDTSDEARYQRFRDLRTGPFVDGFRFGRENEHWSFDARADHVGYRDQRYVANFNHFGKVKASVEWNQIPLFFSQDTSTLFSSPSPGVLLLPDAIQRGTQNGTTTLRAVAGQATPFDLRLKRSIADVRVIYRATTNLDLSVSFKNTQKTGGQPWAGTFGFSDAVELEAPIDTRTTEFGAVAEWTHERGEVRVGYDSSFFETTSGRSSGTTHCGSPIRRLPVPVRAGWRCGRTAISTPVR